MMQPLTVFVTLDASIGIQKVMAMGILQRIFITWMVRECSTSQVKTLSGRTIRKMWDMNVVL